MHEVHDRLVRGRPSGRALSRNLVHLHVLTAEDPLECHVVDDIRRFAIEYPSFSSEIIMRFSYVTSPALAHSAQYR